MQISIIFWAVIGFVFLVIEIISTHFVLLFFGVAAFIVALVKLFGLNSLPAELAIFGGVGLASLLLLRKKLVASFEPKNKVLVDQGKALILSADLPPRGRSQVEYQGVLWTAVNESDQPLKKGDTVAIVRTDGVHLILHP